MRAKDVMTQDVVTVGAAATVPEIARLLLEHRISAVPVLDAGGRVAGIVSEGDLVRRIGDTDTRGSWWLRVFSGSESPEAYIRRHGRRADEIMTRTVISVTPETPLGEIARLLERKRIKRVPVLDDAGRLVGIISRANLVQGLAVSSPLPGPERSDAALRRRVFEALQAAPGFVSTGVNMTVSDGVVELWGVVRSDGEEHAARLAAENVDGVRRVETHLGRMPPYLVAD
jgi:CBS-domain-containing membrane protein